VHSLCGPVFSGGAATFSWPGRYWVSVPPGTDWQALGTFWSSPGRNVVTSDPKPRFAEPPPPAVRKYTTTAITTASAPPPTANSSLRRLRRSARRSPRESLPRRRQRSENAPM